MPCKQANLIPCFTDLMNKLLARDNPNLLVANSLLSPTGDIKLTECYWEPSRHNSVSTAFVCSMIGAAFKPPPMPACSYVEEITSVTMLTAKTAHSGFETVSRRYQNFKTGVSVAP